MSKVKVIFIYVSLEVSNFFRRVKEITIETFKKIKTNIKKIFKKGE